MKTLPYVFAITLGIVGCALAQDDPVPIPKPTLKFVVKDDTKTVQSSSVSMLCEDGVYFDKEHVKPVAVMVVQQVKSLTRLQSDAGDDYSLASTAYLGADDYPKKKIWSMQDNGSSGELLLNFYHTTAPEQGENLPTERYYDLKTGHLIYTSNTELLGIMTKGQDRFIAIRRQYEDTDFPHGIDHNTFAGMIFYGDGDHVIKKLVITGPDQDGVPDQPYIQLVDQGKVVLEGEIYRDEVKTYELLVTLAEGSFHIPFDANGPLLDQVKDLPKGFAIKEVPE